MKPCPFCAEEIQDAAIVCKHCGRDLKGGASQVQIVQPKKDSGCLKLGCFAILALIGVGFVVSLFSPSRSSTGTSSPGRTATPASEERYLASRTGAALERTVKNIISQSGYSCDRIRTIDQIESEFLRRVAAEDGRWVDCGADGVYGVLEVPGGFKAVKR